MRKVLIATLSTGALLAVAGPASAVTATNTFQVQATVQKNCLVSGANLNFGTYTPGAGALTGNSAITVRCTKTTPYTVSLDAGNSGGTLAQRLLKNGASTLQYNLYTTSGLGTVWGDGTGGTGTIAGTGNGVSAASAQTLTVYGQLPDSATNQDVTIPAAGSFVDTITVTVTY
jgi:spore coat protein U-like protein